MFGQAIRRGQIDLKQAITGIVLSVLAWFGGTTWTRWSVAEDWRRQLEAVVKQSAEDHAVLVALPTEELKKIPSRVERMEVSVITIERNTSIIVSSLRPKK